MAQQRINLRGYCDHLAGRRWGSLAQVRIGRLEGMEVVLDDPSISRRHAEILTVGNGWVVRDLGSNNGTFLNGVRVGRTGQEVKDQDILQTGNLFFQIEIVQETDSQAAETPLSTKSDRQELGVEAWERSLQGCLAVPERLTSDPGLLNLLCAGYRLCYSETLDDTLPAILTDMAARFRSRRAAILLVDNETGKLMFSAAGGPGEPNPANVRAEIVLARRTINKEHSAIYDDVPGTPALCLCALMRTPRRLVGVLCLWRDQKDESYSALDLSLADGIAVALSVGIEAVQQSDGQKRLFLQTITALAQAVELRDEYTGRHTDRVTHYALLLADEIGVSVEERRQLQIATPLHDIGKIGILDRILGKPGRLTEEEYGQMRSHVLKGAAILEMIPELAPLTPIIRNHHERWDGQGYPDGLAGKEIPRPARIVAVADAFDAMTSDRPYRAALPLDQAFQELAEKAGSHFDPECVQAFLRLRPRVAAILSEEHLLERLSETVSPTLTLRKLNMS